MILYVKKNCQVYLKIIFWINDYLKIKSFDVDSGYQYFFWLFLVHKLWIPTSKS